MVYFTPLEDKHLTAIADIYNTYVLTTTVSFDLEPASIEKMRAMALHEKARYCSYVILDDSELIGYILLSPFIKKQACDRTAEISIYLHPQSRQRGIGKQALAFIEERARELGFHTLIGVICTENEPSISLFAGQGYKRKGVLYEVAFKFERFLDVVYMQKLLS